MSLPLKRALSLALAALATPGCTQNDASVTEGAGQIVLTTTGGSASLFSLVGVVVLSALGIALWRATSEGARSPLQTRDKLFVFAILTGMFLLYAHEGASRPVVEVSAARREVRLAETLLGVVVHEKSLSADRIRVIRSRKFHRSNKWKRGDWGSIRFVARDGADLEFEASQGFANRAPELASKMGKMLGIPVEQAP